MPTNVCTILPTYNERDNIALLIDGVLENAVTPHRVIVVDDNSPDGTGALADRLASKDPQVHVMHRLGKEGLGAAYLAGFQWSLEHDFDVIVEMDADGSHKPEQLHRLLAALRNADLVLGSRWVDGGEVVNWHKGRANHPALVQVAPLPVHRDFNKDGKRTGDKVETGMFGINQHGTRPAKVIGGVGNWSEGCLVGQYWPNHLKFIETLKQDARYQADNNFLFTTAVIDGDAFATFNAFGEK